jgi:hypothetical protein
MLLPSALRYVSHPRPTNKLRLDKHAGKTGDGAGFRNTGRNPRIDPSLEDTELTGGDLAPCSITTPGRLHPKNRHPGLDFLRSIKAQGDSAPSSRCWFMADRSLLANRRTGRAPLRSRVISPQPPL